MANNQFLPETLTESYLLRREIYNEETYLCGYSTVMKRKCEIPLFVSPTFRILRFIEGVADWKVDGRIHRFQAEDIVVFNNVCKRNIDKVFTGRIIFEMIDFYPTILSRVKLWRPFFSDNPLVSRPPYGKAVFINQLFDQLKSEVLTQDAAPCQKDSITSLINLLSILFLRENQHSNIAFPQFLYSISDSIQYISEHSDEKITLSDLASRYGYTPEYYSRLFKRHTGLSPIQYLINSRIDKTIRLIQDKNATILDAAFRCGFQSSSAFYKAFKAYRGTTPTAYLLKKDL